MSTLESSQRGPVTLLKLSRAAKRNALNLEMITGIEMFFRSPPEGTCAVVLHAEGNHFSAGLDFSTITQTRPAAGIQHSRAWHRSFEQIEHGQVPVIAVLKGAVIGGGLELAAAAHIRVAERSAYYTLPEGMHGIFVGGGGRCASLRLISTARMMDMMLTGRTYGADEGVLLGFSQYVVEDGQGLAKGIELAERIASNATLSNFAVIQAAPHCANRSGNWTLDGKPDGRDCRERQRGQGASECVCGKASIQGHQSIPGHVSVAGAVGPSKGVRTMKTRPVPMYQREAHFEPCPDGSLLGAQP